MTHIGSSSLSYSSGPVYLNNVLRVPEIRKGMNFSVSLSVRIKIVRSCSILMAFMHRTIGQEL